MAEEGLTSGKTVYEHDFPLFPFFSPASGYSQVTVFNPGVNATLVPGSYNANGTFRRVRGDPPITVSSSGSNQSFWLNWASTPSTLTTGQYATYLRIRITAASLW